MAIPNPNPNIADGVKCDNKTYSSNKIESLISTATELPIPEAGDAGKVLTVNSDADGYELDSITHPDPVIYTETERRVGSWIDESAIYQKTVTLSNQTIPKNDSLTILVSDLVSDVDILIDCKIIADISTDKLILPYSYGASAYTAFITEVAASASSIVISRGNSADLLADLIITLTYTKSS